MNIIYCIAITIQVDDDNNDDTLASNDESGDNNNDNDAIAAPASTQKQYANNNDNDKVSVSDEFKYNVIINDDPDNKYFNSTNTKTRGFPTAKRNLKISEDKIINYVKNLSTNTN